MNFILNSIYEMSLFNISMHIECWEETKCKKSIDEQN